jgi:hypothetical protein
MSFSADALYKVSETELLAAYAEARRQFVEKKTSPGTKRIEPRPTSGRIPGYD